MQNITEVLYLEYCLYLKQPSLKYFRSQGFHFFLYKKYFSYVKVHYTDKALSPPKHYPYRNCPKSKAVKFQLQVDAGESLELCSSSISSVPFFMCYGPQHLVLWNLMRCVVTSRLTCCNSGIPLRHTQNQRGLLNDPFIHKCLKRQTAWLGLPF